MLLWRWRSQAFHSKALKYEYHIEVSKAASGGASHLEVGNDILEVSTQCMKDKSTHPGSRKEPLQMGQLWPLNLEEMTQLSPAYNTTSDDTYSISAVISETKLDYVMPSALQWQRCRQYLEDPRRKLLYSASPQLADHNHQELSHIVTVVNNKTMPLRTDSVLSKFTKASERRINSATALSATSVGVRLLHLSAQSLQQDGRTDNLSNGGACASLAFFSPTNTRTPVDIGSALPASPSLSSGIRRRM
ncbi:hypothetical protein LSAT2_008662 [Lamellibrachia satsuma]|nr:hypothetical protein LSAT2_008662 [Lamellibrachia satsuma]